MCNARQRLRHGIGGCSELTLFPSWARCRCVRWIPLTPDALSVLDSVDRVPGNPWVFVGIRDGTPVGNLTCYWMRLRKKMGLEDVRLHDLRPGLPAVSRRVTIGRHGVITPDEARRRPALLNCTQNCTAPRRWPTGWWTRYRQYSPWQRLGDWCRRAPTRVRVWTSTGPESGGVF